MKRALVFFLTLLLFLSGFSGSSFASSMPPAAGSGIEAERVIAFSKKVEKYLASHGARVAIVARIGRPRKDLPAGINFTHAGFAVYSRIKTADGRTIPGYAMYNLYQRAKETDKSDLVQDFPADFFAGVQELEAGIIIPAPELQKRLLHIIASDVYAKLHNPKYSAISSPFNTKFQNCTEFVLDVIIAAIYQTDDIKLIKANEKAYFEPQPVRVNPIELALGSVFIDDVAISDHQGRPATATFTTLQLFLEKYNAVDNQAVLKESEL